MVLEVLIVNESLKKDALDSYNALNNKTLTYSQFTSIVKELGLNEKTIKYAECISETLSDFRKTAGDKYSIIESLEDTIIANTAIKLKIDMEPDAAFSQKKYEASLLNDTEKNAYKHEVKKRLVKCLADEIKNLLFKYTESKINNRTIDKTILKNTIKQQKSEIENMIYTNIEESLHKKDRVTPKQNVDITPLLNYLFHTIRYDEKNMLQLKIENSNINGLEETISGISKFAEIHDGLVSAGIPATNDATETAYLVIDKAESGNPMQLKILADLYRKEGLDGVKNYLQ